MTERKTNARADKQPSSEMTHGHVYLTKEEVKLLRLRRKHRHKNISSTIQELVKSAIDRFENADFEERKKQLREYAEQLFSKQVTLTSAIEDSKPPPYESVSWTLPMLLVKRFDNLATQGKFDRENLMSVILSNAIDMRDNN